MTWGIESAKEEKRRKKKRKGYRMLNNDAIKGIKKTFGQEDKEDKTKFGEQLEKY